MGSFMLVVVAVILVGEAVAITPPDTSLDTLPVGYFGGVNCKTRSQESIQMLAKMRVIVIEKWEGPCWYECYANLTMKPPVPCQPSCGAENYQMETIKQAKTLNPNLAAVFYLNTLYDFPFLALHGKFLGANADIIDVNGKPVAFKNDNGMPNINIFGLGQETGRDMWIDFVKSLKDSGYVDGMFPDKHNILASWNETSSFWQICEFGDVHSSNWNISCGVISEETAKNYNAAKPKVLDTLYETFAPDGFLFFSNITDFIRGRTKNVKSPLKFAEDVRKSLSTYKYCYVHKSDLQDKNCNTTMTKSICNTDDIALFLLAVEKGAILGCNGWDNQFSKPLGDPLGSAMQKGGQVERHFKSGTYVTWDLTKNTGKVFWNNSTTSG